VLVPLPPHLRDGSVIWTPSFPPNPVPTRTLLCAPSFAFPCGIPCLRTRSFLLDVLPAPIFTLFLWPSCCGRLLFLSLTLGCTGLLALTFAPLPRSHTGSTRHSVDVSMRTTPTLRRLCEARRGRRNVLLGGVEGRYAVVVVWRGVFMYRVGARF